MTSTVERRPLPRASATPAATPSQLMGSGALAAAWALGAGLVAVAVPVLLVWAADRRSGAGTAEASRTAGLLWLLAHGSTFKLPSGAVGLVPLGLTALPLALLHRAGRHSARQLKVRLAGDAARLVAAIALPYALAATLLSVALTTDDVSPVAGRALLGAMVIAVVGTGSGVLRDAGLLPAVRRFFPERLRVLAHAGAIAAGVLVAAGAVVVVIGMLMHLSKVTTLAGATGPGVVGGAGLVALQLLLLPNLALWGASWLTGPGFAVGVGTTVSPWEVTLGAVPALPVLGALPSAAPPSWVGFVTLLVPVVIGVVAGRMVASRLGPRTLGEAGLDAAGIGAVTGALVALLALLSGGPLGSERLAAVGPSAWQVGLAVFGEVALGAVVVLALRSRR
jgi:hypothetical protein